MVNALDADGDRELSLDEIKIAARKVKDFRTVLDKLSMAFQEQAKRDPRDAQKTYQGWMSSGTATFANAKEGVHYPIVNRFVAAIRENEEKLLEIRFKKQEALLAGKKYRIADGLDNEESFGDEDVKVDQD
jgi:hypothetical protein